MATQGTRRALKPEEQHVDTPSGPRPFWSGTITFGLVSIPVNLYPGVRSTGIRTRMLSADGTPVRRRYYCPNDEQDLERDDIVRGYEVEEGQWVVITDEDLEAVAPRKSRDIDLRRFVGVDELDPFLFENTYILTPGGESEKAYRLLADVMERESKAGIATFVMREKEYLVAIMADKGILRAETLRFSDEVRSPRAVELPEHGGKAQPKLVSAFEHQIEKHAKADISREELSDERTKKLEQLVERKHRNGDDVIHARVSAAADEEESEGGGADVDLMEAIRRSLRGESGGGRKKPHRARERGASERSKASPSRTRKKTASSRSRSTASGAKAKRR
jgi:DNA end-binding protein Ku